MENHIYTYSPTNYRVSARGASHRDPDTMFLSHHGDVDIGPPGVASVGLNSSSSAAHLLSQASSWPAAAFVAAANVGTAALDLKRSSETLFYPTIFGIQNTIGQREAWYSTNSLAKRPRHESGSNLPIYPQRPGEKDCAHYMLTRTCKFGDSCKFDHPIWVPEAGIPDWKEVPNVATIENLPERPGEPDCPHFLKTQICKFGSRCKFNHPKISSENADVPTLPERPSEPLCAFYVKTGKCKFGTACKFHHPKDIQIQISDELNCTSEQTGANSMTEGATAETQATVISPLLHNSKGLPLRLGEVDCPFYMKTGSCKYGATCRYNHPDRNAINPSIGALGPSIFTSAAANLGIGVMNPALPVYQTFDSTLSIPMVGMAEVIYPQRSGEIECDYYMKTGVCKFGEKCKFHHPIDRSAPSLSNKAIQQTVKLTPAGLPRREGVAACPYYMKTGTCMFGATCKFDHPPPGEVMEMAKSQGTPASNGWETKGLEKEQQ